MFVCSIVYSNIHSFIRLFPTTRNKINHYDNQQYP
nr:MAG TPA: hypothetical protein [Caudoviricetes sp.]